MLPFHVKVQLSSPKIGVALVHRLVSYLPLFIMTVSPLFERYEPSEPSLDGLMIVLGGWINGGRGSVNGPWTVNAPILMVALVESEPWF